VKQLLPNEPAVKKIYMAQLASTNLSKRIKFQMTNLENPIVPNETKTIKSWTNSEGIMKFHIRAHTLRSRNNQIYS